MNKVKDVVLKIGVASILFASPSSAEIINLQNGLLKVAQGYSLPDESDYESWYGCSPTIAGMMLGTYDRNGYNNKSYDNLLAGAVAEENTYGNPDALVNEIIASNDHIAEYYIDEYGAIGDDNPMGDGVAGWHAANSLADFMGTNQDAVGSANGSTWFFYYGDGSKLDVSDLTGTGYEDYDGMYGMCEYITYCGYEALDLYTQATDNTVDGGFSFDDYKNEIDNGRSVMVQVDGHSLFGYGYDDDNILFHDTKDPGSHSMAWGGSYSGKDLWGVTCLTIDGGTSVPEPSSISLLVLGFSTLLLLCRKQPNKR